MASISKRVFKQADQAEVAVLKAEHETKFSEAFSKATADFRGSISKAKAMGLDKLVSKAEDMLTACVNKECKTLFETISADWVKNIITDDHYCKDIAVAIVEGLSMVCEMYAESYVGGGGRNVFDSDNELILDLQAEMKAYAEDYISSTPGEPTPYWAILSLHPTENYYSSATCEQAFAEMWGMHMDASSMLFGEDF